MDFYNATNGPQWRQAKQWLDGDPCTQIWQGVYWDHSGSYVTGLYEGCYQFERGVWELMEREWKREGWNDKERKRNDDGLMKWHHRLLSKDLPSGTLPSSIGALQIITFLYDISDNSYSTLWISYITFLSHLYYNSLSGSLPSEIGSLSLLSSL